MQVGCSRCGRGEEGTGSCPGPRSQPSISARAISVAALQPTPIRAGPSGTRPKAWTSFPAPSLYISAARLLQAALPLQCRTSDLKRFRIFLLSITVKTGANKRQPSNGMIQPATRTATFPPTPSASKSPRCRANACRAGASATTLNAIKYAHVSTTDTGTHSIHFLSSGFFFLTRRKRRVGASPKVNSMLAASVAYQVMSTRVIVFRPDVSDEPQVRSHLLALAFG